MFLGIDFIVANKLIIDVANRSLCGPNWKLYIDMDRQKTCKLIQFAVPCRATKSYTVKNDTELIEVEIAADGDNLSNDCNICPSTDRSLYIVGAQGRSLSIVYFLISI